MSKRSAVPGSTGEIGPRPSVLWRLFVLTGIPVMTVLATNDRAWESWESAVGDTVPRDRIRKMLAGTAALHATESVLTYRSAKKAGVPHPRRWGLATLVYGFPVVLRLRRAKKALRA